MDPYAQYNSGEINEDDGDQNNVAYDEYDRGEEDYNPFKGFSMLKALEVNYLFIDSLCMCMFVY